MQGNATVQVTDELLRENPGLRRLAGRLVSDPDLADDAVQETWLAALKQPPRSDGNPAAWMRTVLKNRTLNLLRTRARETEATRRYQNTLSEGSVSENNVPESLAAALNTLDANTREMILRRYVEDETAESLAEVFNLPPATVRTRLRRGLQKLRAELDRVHGDRARWATPFALWLARPERATASASLVVGGALVVVLGLGAWWALSRETSPSLATSSFTGSTAEAAVEPVDTTVPFDSKKDVPNTAQQDDRGLVMDTKGVPIPGAFLVTITPESFDATPLDSASALHTDESGHFPLPSKDRAVTFVAWSPHHGPTLYSLPRERGRVRIPLPEGTKLFGRVTDGNNAVRNAQVTWRGIVHGCALTLHARSDEQGRFAITGLPARLDIATRAVYETTSLVVSADGFAPHVMRLPGAWADTTSLTQDVALTHGRTIHCTVMDGITSEAINEGEIRIWQWMGPANVAGIHHPVRNPFDWIDWAATSDPDGGFRLTLPIVSNAALAFGTLPATALSAHAPRYARTFESMEILGDSVSIRLWPQTTISGTVMENDRPLKNERVRLVSRQTERVVWPRRFASDAIEAITDATGRYQFTEYPYRPGEPVSVAAALDGLLVFDPPSVVAPLTPTTTTLPPLVLPALRTLEVNVVTQDGTAIASALISRDNPSELSEGFLGTRTNQAGKARVSLVQNDAPLPGLFVSSPGFATQKTPAITNDDWNDRALTLTMGPEHVFTGRFLNDRRRPPTKARVVFAEPGTDVANVLRRSRQSRVVDQSILSLRDVRPDGRLRVGGLPTPPWVLGVMDLTIPDSPTISVFHVERAQSAQTFILKSVITDDDRGDLEVFVEGIAPDQRDGLSAFLERDDVTIALFGVAPVLSARRIPKGRWTLTVEAPGHVPHSLTVDLSPEALCTRTITLRASTRVEGELRAHGRELVRGGVLEASARKRNHVLTTTFEGDGRFEFKDLDPDCIYDLRIYAYATGGVFMPRNPRLLTAGEESRSFVTIDIAPANRCYVRLTGNVPSASVAADILDQDGTVLSTQTRDAGRRFTLYFREGATVRIRHDDETLAESPLATVRATGSIALP